MNFLLALGVVSIFFLLFCQTELVEVNHFCVKNIFNSIWWYYRLEKTALRAVIHDVNKKRSTSGFLKANCCHYEITHTVIKFCPSRHSSWSKNKSSWGCSYCRKSFKVERIFHFVFFFFINCRLVWNFATDNPCGCSAQCLWCCQTMFVYRPFHTILHLRKKINLKMSCIGKTGFSHVSLLQTSETFDHVGDSGALRIK